MLVTQVPLSLKDRDGDLANHLHVDGPNALVYRVEGTLVHELHPQAYIRLCEIRAVGRNDEGRVAVANDL